jgi:hypothetical protein
MTAAASTAPTLAGIASTAETVIEDILKVEPTVATIAGMFVPGAAPVVAMVQPMILAAAPFVEKALSDLASGNSGDLMESFIQLLQHLSPAHANSPILSPPTADPSAITTG